MTLRRLTKSQINRIYDVYDFDTKEKILSAWLDINGRFYIQYKDVEGLVATYEPSTSELEDLQKIQYVLGGGERP